MTSKTSKELSTQDKAKIIAEEFTWYRNVMSKWVNEDKWTEGRVSTVDERWDIRGITTWLEKWWKKTPSASTKGFVRNVFTAAIYKTRIFKGTEYVHVLLVGRSKDVVVWRTRDESKVLPFGEDVDRLVRYGEPMDFAGYQVGTIKTMKMAKY